MGSKEVIIYGTISVYLAVMLIVSVLSSRNAKNVNDFAVGKRNASAWLSAFSYGTAYFSAVMFIGYAGTTGWNYGIWGVLPGLGNAIFGALFAWLVLANRTRDITRRHDIRSMPQFFEKRFSDKVMKQFCVFVIFIFLIPYSASVYKGLTSVCSILLGIDEMLCCIIIACVAAVLVVLGGYMATLKADFLQGIVMVGGVIALIIVIMRTEQVGGITDGIKNIANATKDLSLSTKDHISLWATVLMTSFGTWGLPQMIHKYYGIKDKAEVKRGTVISTLFCLIIAGGGYFIGSLSRLFPDAFADGVYDNIIPNMLVIAKVPTILLGIILVLLISASVSTLASITITAATTLTMDFISPVCMKKASGEKVGAVCKIVSVLFILLSFVIAITPDTPILVMMSYSWGIISGSFMAPYILSLYWKKINRFGAWVGMIGGFLTALPPLVCKLGGISAQTPLGQLSSMGPHFACLAMAVSFPLCCIGTKIYNSVKKTEETNDDFYLTEISE